MKFQADVESLTVLVSEGRFCGFVNGLYETNNAEEIAALGRAKGVKELNIDGCKDTVSVKKVEKHAEVAKSVPKKSGARVGNAGRQRRRKSK